MCAFATHATRWDQKFNPTALPDFTNSIGMKLKSIQDDTFTMVEGVEAKKVTLTRNIQAGRP